jgi:membrane associated rhomboid family serine protease
MRYVIAMVFAFIGAAFATLFLGSSVADWVVGRLSFESPDEADNLHMLVFIGTNVAGLLVGWLMGWIIGGGAGPKAPPA